MKRDKEHQAMVDWAKKRADNSKKTLRKTSKDDALLLKVAGETLQSLADAPRQIGDDVGSAFLSTLGIQLQSLSKRLAKTR